MNLLIRIDTAYIDRYYSFHTEKCQHLISEALIITKQIELQEFIVKYKPKLSFFFRLLSDHKASNIFISYV